MIKHYISGILFCIIAIGLFVASLNGQIDLPKSLDWYEEEADKAIASENYEYAVKTLQEAQRMYPDSVRFYLELGELYRDHEFFKLALSEYLKADKNDPNNFDILDQIQQIYSLLNEEQKAIDVLTKMLEFYPVDNYEDSYWIVDDLGWMYYKTFQNRKGIELLEETLKSRSETDVKRSLWMTLGTLYSGIYDYENSKHNYLQAINEALDADNSHFASVAYYNLALLEHSFYHFSEALDYTNKALIQEDRATGHLSRGELFQAQMDFSSALDEYIKGDNLDSSPLNKINLTLLYLLFGDLKMAEAYANEVFFLKDTSWMVNFGTDLDRYYQQLHQIMGDLYDAKARQSVLLPKENIFDTLASFFEEIRLNLLSYYHRQKFKNYSIIVGKANLSEGNNLDAYLEFYESNRDYKDVALKYLDLARELETRILPHSDFYYSVDYGRLQKKPDLIKRAIDNFDSQWEKEILLDAYSALVQIEVPGSHAQFEALNKLYEINPGALLQKGFSLPLAVNFSLTGNRIQYQGALTSHFKTCHPYLLVNQSYKTEYRYRLTITWGTGNLYYKLHDSEKNKILLSGEIQIDESSIKPHVIVKEIILDGIYNGTKQNN